MYGIWMIPCATCTSVTRNEHRPQKCAIIHV